MRSSGLMRSSSKSTREALLARCASTGTINLSHRASCCGDYSLARFSRLVAASWRAPQPDRVAVERGHSVRVSERFRGCLAGDLSQSGDAPFWSVSRRLVPFRLAVAGLRDPGGNLRCDRLLSAGTTLPLSGGVGPCGRLRVSLGYARGPPFLPG